MDEDDLADLGVETPSVRLGVLAAIEQLMFKVCRSLELSSLTPLNPTVHSDIRCMIVRSPRSA